MLNLGFILRYFVNRAPGSQTMLACLLKEMGFQSTPKLSFEDKVRAKKCSRRLFQTTAVAAATSFAEFR